MQGDDISRQSSNRASHGSVNGASDGRQSSEEPLALPQADHAVSAAAAMDAAEEAGSGTGAPAVADEETTSVARSSGETEQPQTPPPLGSRHSSWSTGQLSPTSPPPLPPAMAGTLRTISDPVLPKRQGADEADQPSVPLVSLRPMPLSPQKPADTPFSTGAFALARSIFQRTCAPNSEVAAWWRR